MYVGSRSKEKNKYSVEVQENLLKYWNKVFVLHYFPPLPSYAISYRFADLRQQDVPAVHRLGGD